MNFETIVTRLKNLRAAFTAVQLISLGAAFLAVVGLIIGAAWWLNTPTYQVLFGDLDAESAGRVAERLRSRDIPFQIADGGRAIMVPDKQIDELRLDFAMSGVPASGRLGYEIFDRTQFGATEFLENVNFRRALEGELARTIASISEVASARVHIAMAKEHLFADREEPTKASVVLALKSKRPPAPSFVQGIAALMAASVEGLQPEAVVVMDTFGRPLARPGAESEALAGGFTEQHRSLEHDLAQKIVQLVAPAVGGEQHVRANVALQVHQDAADEVEESWDSNPVVRSRGVTLEGSAGSGVTQGLAGSRANIPGPVLPGDTAPVTSTQAPSAVVSSPVVNPVRSAETVNYEIGKKVRHTTRPSGGVARLSVAVLVDDERYVDKDKSGQTVTKTRPRAPADLQKLNQLVSAAVGLDPTRGDLLTVENIAFNEMPIDELPAPTVLERVAPYVGQGLKVVVVLALCVIVFFFIGRPLVHRVVDARPVEDAALLPKQLPRTVEEIEGQIAAELEAAALASDRRLPVLTRKLTGLTQKDPEVAARLVRSWLAEEQK